MKPAIRSQVDDLGDEYSLATGLDCSALPDLARQEFRDEVDVNRLLSRFGIEAAVVRVPQFGDVDFDLDLHTAYIARERAQYAFTRLPAELRERYGDVGAMLDAMNSGELDADLRALRREAGQEGVKAAAPASTPAGGEIAPSGGAQAVPPVPGA